MTGKKRGHRSTEQLLAEAEARAAQLKQRARRERDRRLLLIGVAMESWARQNEEQRQALQDTLDRHITAERDRKFLGLEPRKETNEQAKPADS